MVGHDWGAIVAWQLCLLRPDLVRALVNLSVVYHPRRPEMSPLQTIRAACGEDHYMCRFQVNKVEYSASIPIAYCYCSLLSADRINQCSLFMMSSHVPSSALITIGSGVWHFSLIWQIRWMLE